jgi:hypothetical protein
MFTKYKKSQVRMKCDEKQKILNKVLALYNLGDKDFVLSFEEYIAQLETTCDDKGKKNLSQLEGEIYGLHRAIIYLNIRYKTITCIERPDFCVIDNEDFKYFLEVTSNGYESTSTGKYKIITSELDNFLKEKGAKFKAQEILDILPNDDRLSIQNKGKKTNHKITSDNRLIFCKSFLRLNKVDILCEDDQKILCEYIGKYAKKRDTIAEYRQDFKIETISSYSPNVDAVHCDEPEELQIDDISDRINDKFKKYYNDTKLELGRLQVLVIDNKYTRYNILNGDDDYDTNTSRSFKDLLLNKCEALKEKHNYFDHVLIIYPIQKPSLKTIESLDKFWILKYSTEENKWGYLN